MSALLCTVALAFPSQAEALAVDFQATLLKKILMYNRAVDDPATAQVLVLARDSDRDAQHLVDTLARIGMRSQRTDNLGEIEEADVLVVREGFNQAEVSALSESLQALTVSDNGEWARSGRVTLALTVGSTGRPHMVVNLPRMKREGQKLSGSILRLAETIE